MADKKIALVASILFGVFVLVLLLFLYYPDPTLDIKDINGNEMPADVTDKPRDNFEYTVAPDTQSVIANTAKLFQEMGASFLALLAVLCISFGLACLTCACCCRSSL